MLSRRLFRLSLVPCGSCGSGARTSAPPSSSAAAGEQGSGSLAGLGSGSLAGLGSAAVFSALGGWKRSKSPAL